MNCDYSPVFEGLALPADAGAYVAINGIQLIPSPYVNLNLEKYVAGDKVIGGVLKLVLNGEVIGSSFNEVVDGQGAPGIKDILELAKNQSCVTVQIQCTTTLINGYGRIISASFDEGQQPTWVNRASYSIQIDLYENNTGTSDNRVVIPDFNHILGGSKVMLKALSEELSWSISEESVNAGSGCYTPGGIDLFGDRHIKLNFSISATGIDACGITGSGSIVYGLEAVELYISKRLNGFVDFNTSNSLSYITGYDSVPTEIRNASINYFSGNSSYMDFRTVAINPNEQTISITGEIIYRPKNCLNPEVFTDITIEQDLGVDSENFTISGSIRGLSNHKFDDIIRLANAPNEFNDCSFNTKLNRAESFLTKIKDHDTLVDMVLCYASQEGYIKDTCIFSVNSDPCVTSTIAPTPEPPDLCSFRVISQQIGRNLSNGEINFTFNLSNSPNCDVLGATKLDVSYTHDRPHDNIVEIIIPGRGYAGALVQNLCCSSVEKYDVSIDAVLNKKNCNFDFKTETISNLRACAVKLLQEIQDTDPSISFDCWFLTNDTETIGNNTYKLNRTYVKPSC